MERSIFISYSSQDKAAADQICADLEAAGFGCWIAPRDISPGQDYPAAILDGLRHARAVVVLVSPAAVASPHILSEIGHAFSEKKPIIPFRLSAADLPPDFDYFLSLSQWLDARDGCSPANLTRLREAVSHALSGGLSLEPLKTRRLDWRIPAIAAAALVLLAGIAYWLWPSKPVVTDNKTTEALKLPPAENQPQPWVNPKDELTYVWIPPGTFTMGCSAGDTECKPDEAPSHLVELPAGFRIGQTEVTNAAYQHVVKTANFPAAEANLPVVNVSRRQAKAYCTAVGGRLPTEAEWEYAARGGNPGAYYGVPSKIAWYAANSGSSRHPVASLQPNAYGLYDILGNASEWVLDRYYNKYGVEAPAIGKVDEPLAGNASAVTRGGYWESDAENIRVSRRAEMDSIDPAPMAGFRCIVDRQ